MSRGAGLLAPAARRRAREPRAPRQLSVLLLVREDLVPPRSAPPAERASAPWRTEYDVAGALRRLGHRLLVLPVGDEIDVVRRTCAEFRPDVVFNLLVEFHGAASYDQHVASYLELLKQPYTGCNPLGLTLARDKALAKKILLHHGVRVPRFQVFERGHRVRAPRELAFPLFVKTLNEEASLGISQASVVRSAAELASRVAFVHEGLGASALVEEFVPGRECTVGVLGHRRPTTLPIWELSFERLSPRAANIATRRVKWDVSYQKRIGVVARRARGLAPRTAAALARAARIAYRALGLSGCARLDFRVRADDEVFLLEANPNPDLARGDDLADAARAAGLPYPALVQRLLDLALSYPAAWKGG